jgi:DNA-directed RNA polymerase I and III subunit RPAC1
VFKLVATGKTKPREEAAARREGGQIGSADDISASPYTSVYSREITWDAQGTQTERYTEPAAPVHGDICVAKLAPGQEIDVEMHAVKGVGKDHAKFSPVATAAYRLLPSITIVKDFVDEEADALVKRCPVGVFDIEDLAGA